jgi:hypothetical protein
MRKLDTLRSNTLDAANAARQRSLISEEQLKRLTDGTVSSTDLAIAAKVLFKAKRSGDEEAVGAAKQLAHAVGSQFNRQSIRGSTIEPVKDVISMIRSRWAGD